MAGGVPGRIVVRVTPRSGMDAVDGAGPGGELRVRVRAAPIDGAANRAVIRLVADSLGVPPTSVVLEAGQEGRSKRLRVPAEAVAMLRAAHPGVRVTEVGAARGSR